MKLDSQGFRSSFCDRYRTSQYNVLGIVLGNRLLTRLVVTAVFIEANTVAVYVRQILLVSILDSLFLDQMRYHARNDR